jgi:hypothetical protein
MNLNLPDLSTVSRLFGGLVSELRQKRLWPVVALLVVALGAVPFLLKKSSHPATEAQTPIATPPPNPATTLPALNVQSTPPHSRLSGVAHNPFGNASPATTGTTSVTSSAASTALTAAGTTASTLSGGAGTSPGATGTGAPSLPSTGSSAPAGSGAPTNTPPSITHGAAPTPAPSGLKPTQAYDVAMAITNSSGGLDTVDPLQRLSPIPSAQQPLLVELGVAQDGNHVLFVVQPGALPTGPGTCTPGPIDCEILSLGQDQTEQLSARQGSIGASQVALFAITSITAANYGSDAAADKVRRETSSAGRALLNKSSYPTLSLFQYEPSVGSVVDLRNLKVGG